MRVRVHESLRITLLVAGVLILASLVVVLRYTTRDHDAVAQTPGPDPRRSVVFSNDFRTVLTTTLAVLAEQGIPVSYVSREWGLIRTGSVSVGQNRMRQLTTEGLRPVVDRLGRQGGRYVLQFSIKSVSVRATRVSVESLIVLRIAESASAVGGQVVPSSMRIETEFLEKMAARLRTSR